MDKSEIKFYMAIGVETNYLLNCFFNVGKNENKSGDVCLPTNVVMKLSYDALLQKELQQNL